MFTLGNIRFNSMNYPQHNWEFQIECLLFFFRSLEICSLFFRAVSKFNTINLQYFEVHGAIISILYVSNPKSIKVTMIFHAH